MLTDRSCVWLRWLCPGYTWLIEQRPAQPICWAVSSSVAQLLLTFLVFLALIHHSHSGPPSVPHIWMAFPHLCHICSDTSWRYQFSSRGFTETSRTGLNTNTSTELELLLIWLHCSPSWHHYFIGHLYALRYLFNACVFRWSRVGAPPVSRVWWILSSGTASLRKPFFLWVAFGHGVLS